jgi:pimeloyl-ACP methyl ester carboxylesterase
VWDDRRLTTSTRRIPQPRPAEHAELAEDLGQHSVLWGIIPLAFGNPIAASVIKAMLLRVWLRPASRTASASTAPSCAIACAATRLGRAVLFKQIFGWPTRIPADEAVSTLDDAWAAPAFAEALAAFDDYDFAAGDELRGTPVTIAWGKYDRLLIYSRQAPRARERLPWARHVTLGAGHVPFFDDPAAVGETIRLTVTAAEDGPERLPRP